MFAINKAKLAGLILILILFIPALKIGIVYVRFDDILILILLPFLLAKRLKLRININIKIFSILYVYMWMAMIYGYAFMNVNYYSGDIRELIRYSKILILLLYLSSLNYNELTIVIEKILDKGSYVLIAIGFIEYFNIFRLGDFLSRIYSSESQIEGALSEISRRITLTSTGPNDAGVIAAFFINYKFVTFLMFKKNKDLIVLLLLFAILLFTQSRTAMIASFFGILMVSLLMKGNLLLKILLYSAIALIAAVLLPYFEYIYYGLIAFDAGQNNSVNERINNLYVAINHFINSPIFGYGIAKDHFQNITFDSEWLSIIASYGAFGILLALTFLFYPLSYIFKINHENTPVIKNYFVVISFAFIGSVSMLTNNFITGYQSILFFIYFYTLLPSTYRNEKKSYIQRMLMDNRPYNQRAEK